MHFPPLGAQCKRGKTRCEPFVFDAATAIGSTLGVGGGMVGAAAAAAAVSAAAAAGRSEDEDDDDDEGGGGGGCGGGNVIWEGTRLEVWALKLGAGRRSHV